MKKLSIVILMGLLAVNSTACTTGSEGSSSTGESSSVAESSSEKEPKSSSMTSETSSSSKVSSDDKLLKKIIVTCDKQDIIDDKLKNVVWVENKTDKLFSASVYVEFKDEDGKSLGHETIFVDELTPHEKRYAIVWSKISDTMNFEYEIDSVEFVEDKNGKSGAKDKALSKAVSNDIYENFGNFGGEEFATSWYKHIKKISVFKDDNGYYGEVVVSSKNEDDTRSIASAILFTDEIELYKVVAKNKDGKEVYSKTK